MTCDICNFSRCGIKGPVYEPSHQDLDLDMGQCLYEQHLQGKFCDVQLKSGSLRIPVHRCVLAIRCKYFSSMFSSEMIDCRKDEYEIPEASKDHVAIFLKFMYTGKAVIHLKDASGVLKLADYLCLEDLVNCCIGTLAMNLTCDTSPEILNLCEDFLIDNLKVDVIDFISPRAARILSSDAASRFSALSAWTLLMNDKTRYVQEMILLDFLIKWASYSKGERVQAVNSLFGLLVPNYLNRSEIQVVLTRDETLLNLIPDEFLKKVQAVWVSQNEDNPRCDVLICRSRCNQNFPNVNLYIYDLNTQFWMRIKPPLDSNLHGLESVLQWNDAVYVLTSSRDDMCGYLHGTLCRKRLYALSLTDGIWKEIPAPSLRGENCRLFTYKNSLCAMDRQGIMEMLTDVESNPTWFKLETRGFPNSQQCTHYFLPMPADRQLFVLQVVAGSHMNTLCEDIFVLYRYTADEKAYEILGEIDSSNTSLQWEEKIHGYLVFPEKVVLKNGIGRRRLEFNMSSRVWTTVPLDDTTFCPLEDVWGYAQFRDRTYMVGRDVHYDQNFVFYDWKRNRFKAVSKPPAPLSGLLVYGSMSHDMQLKITDN